MSLELLADWPVPTAAAAVVDRTGIVESHGPLDHVFHLASVTKPLAALAILIACEEEAITLDDAADEDVVPGATLRHLLSHSSGYAADDRRRQTGVATRRIYSNAGIERAAELVEGGTDLPFADYLREAVLAPLSMADTSLAGSPAHAGRSTVNDVAGVVHELLAPTGLLTAPTLADLCTVQFPGLRGVLPGYGGQDHNDWGLGFEVRNGKAPHWTGSANSPATFGHFGQSGTMFWIDPVAQVGLVALADRAFGPWAVEAWPVLSDAVLAAADPH